MHQSISSSISNALPKKIVVTGAAGRIGYQLLFLLADGKLLGNKQPIILHMLEREHNLSKCRAIQMELEDCTFSLLCGVCYTSCPEEAFSDAEYIFFCGAKIAKSTKEREKICRENWENFSFQGKALNKVASAETLIMVVANPCNTNAWVLLKHAPNIPKENFHALVQLDYNRSIQLLAKKFAVLPSEIEQIVVWGNHSATIVPDISRAKVKGCIVNKLVDPSYLFSHFICQIQSRGNKITLTSGGISSAGSVAFSAIEAMRLLIFKTAKGSFFCSAMHTLNNPFQLDNDLVFSMPCRTLSRGKYELLSDIPPHPDLKFLLAITEEELKKERFLTCFRK